MSIKKCIILIIGTSFLLNCSAGTSSSGSNSEKSWIGYVYAEEPAATMKLAMLDEFGNNNRIIYSTNNSAEQILNLDWFNDGSSILFSTSTADLSCLIKYEISKQKFDTISTTAKYSYRDFSISNDNSSIALNLRDRDSGEWILGIINMDGSNFRQLTFEQSSAPRFSSDCVTIFFVLNGEIYSIDKWGGNLRNITIQKENRVFQFDMTSDGSKIIYSRMHLEDAEENNQLYLTDNSGSFHKTLFDLDTLDTGTPENYIRYPKISPDGNVICFGHRSKTLSFYKFTNNKISSYSNEDRNFTGIYWTVDADKIIYSTNDDNKLNIKQLMSDGSNHTTLKIVDTGYWFFKVSPVKKKF